MQQLLRSRFFLPKRRSPVNCKARRTVWMNQVSYRYLLRREYFVVAEYSLGKTTFLSLLIFFCAHSIESCIMRIMTLERRTKLARRPYAAPGSHYSLVSRRESQPCTAIANRPSEVMPNACWNFNYLNICNCIKVIKRF